NAPAWAEWSLKARAYNAEIANGLFVVLILIFCRIYVLDHTGYWVRPSAGWFYLYSLGESGLKHDPPDHQIRLPTDRFRAGILRMEGIPRVAAPAAEVGGRHHLRVHADAGHNTPGGIDWRHSRAGHDGADVFENGHVESV